MNSDRSIEQKTVEWIAPAFTREKNGVVAGFSTRKGGVSPEPFHALNLGLSTADDPANVQANRDLLFREAGLSVENLVVAGQVHGSEILYATEPGVYPGYDGFVTDCPGLVLTIGTADCAAVLLADPAHRVIGACHSGWKGTVANITGKTIEHMVGLGASPETIRAFVSPCISSENFEVGPEVAAFFEPASVHRFPGKEKPHVDLKETIRRQLRQAGVPSEAIEVSPYCTVARVDTFFSHRAEKGTTGRMMGFIALKPSL